MAPQIIWILFQVIVLTIVWLGTRIQLKRGDISIINAAGMLAGTGCYLFINNLILYVGDFFDPLF